MRLGRWLWAVAALLLVVAAVRMACAMGHRDEHVPSELYRCYENNPHIQAAYMEDYPLNDSLTLDVTILKALDSAGWEQLRNDFDYPVLPPEVEKKIAEHNSIGHKKITENKSDAGNGTVNKGGAYHLVMQIQTRTFFVFQNCTKSYDQQIIDKFFNELINEKKKK